MKNFIIDINGTLTNHDASMNPDFERWMYDFCKHYKVILTTGSSFNLAKKAVRSLTKNVYLVSCNSDNNRYKDDNLILERPKVKFENHLLDYLVDNKDVFRFANEYRINLSSNPGYRYKIIANLEHLFPEYVFFACNDLTSIDILKAGRDKLQLMDQVNDDTVFITDGASYPKYDYTLASKINEVVRVVNYNDTWDYLRDKYNYEESTNTRT